MGAVPFPIGLPTSTVKGGWAAGLPPFPPKIFWLEKLSPVTQCFAVRMAVGVSSVPVHNPFGLRIWTTIAASGEEASLLPCVIAKVSGGDWRAPNRISAKIPDRTPQKIRFCIWFVSSDWSPTQAHSDNDTRRGI